MAQTESTKNSATTKADKQSTAKKYVDDQLELLKQHGSLTKLSKGGYKSIVNQVARITR